MREYTHGVRVTLRSSQRGCMTPTNFSILGGLVHIFEETCFLRCPFPLALDTICPCSVTLFACFLILSPLSTDCFPCPMACPPGRSRTKPPLADGTSVTFLPAQNAALGSVLLTRGLPMPKESNRCGLCWGGKHQPYFVYFFTIFSTML